MSHYPVTPAFWRGVFNLSRGFYAQGRALSRACDWKREITFSVKSPTCPDCLAYKAALVRMGYVR